MAATDASPSPERIGAAPLLALALLLYGAASSPAPTSPGGVEAAIALLLIVAVGARGMVWAASGAGLLTRRPCWQEEAPWLGMAALALPPLALLPTVRALAEGWPAAALPRDLVPLAYLFLPLLLAPAWLGRADGAALRRAAWWLAAGLTAAGLVFAARFLAITGAWGRGLAAPAPSDGLLYLANDPSVGFAAILLSCLALRGLARPSPARLLGAALAGAGALLCLAALALTLQRAALTAWAGCVLVFLVGLAARRPALWLTLPPVLALAYGLAGDTLATLARLLVEKTRLVGFNQHDAEIAATLAFVAESPLRLLFGGGWGALLDSPAVPTQKVGYLHALPLYLLAKAGIVGLLLGLGYLLALAATALRALPHAPALLLACAGPLAVGALIQPSFKYLSFGLCLTLVTLLAAQGTVADRPQPDRSIRRRQRGCC